VPVHLQDTNQDIIEMKSLTECSMSTISYLLFSEHTIRYLHAATVDTYMLQQLNTLIKCYLDKSVHQS